MAEKNEVKNSEEKICPIISSGYIAGIDGCHDNPANFPKCLREKCAFWRNPKVEQYQSFSKDEIKNETGWCGLAPMG